MSLTLFGRFGCHLCDVMQQELQPLLTQYNCELTVEDIDSRQEWQQAYRTLIPVLVASDGHELCHYHLDEQAVRVWLSGQASHICSE